MSDAPNPRALLPLTPLVFQVMLALAAERRHGYAIIRAVETETGGLMRIRTGTLYLLLQRLEDQGLIEESADRPRPHEDDERRRYYALTDFGRAVMKAEARRLEAVVGEARRKRVLGRASRA